MKVKELVEKLLKADQDGRIEFVRFHGPGDFTIYTPGKMEFSHGWPDTPRSTFIQLERDERP